MSRGNLYKFVLKQTLKDFGPDGKIDEGTGESGYISGENLLESGEIIQDAPLFTEEPLAKQEVQMRMDSGVGLSESFSGLELNQGRNERSLKSLSQGFNDLSSFKTRQPPVDAARDELLKQYSQQDDDGDTCLHLAMYKNYGEAVLTLIRRAPHPLLLDTPNDVAETPIHVAASLRHSQTVRWLIIAGAKPSPRNIHGDSPLHIAARNGDLLCCRAITDPVLEQERRSLDLSYPQQPYHTVNLDQWNYEGQTCVHVAAQSGSVEVLRHLVCCGADINAREGRQGYTALHYAIQRGDQNVVNFLLTCSKLNAEAVTYGGRSALQLGFPMPSKVADALRSRGVPYSSDESSDSESESELYENANPMYNACTLVNASA